MGRTLGPLPLLLLTAVAVVSPNCRLSEFFCDTGQCVALDRFCDGADDCGDKSDEPRYCSPCNRTFYGDVGRTYELEIRRPREDRLPFLCHLNFTAAGGDLGDLVQLTFDTFTVGQFVSFTTEGCPDGHMTIRELGRPSTGGQWCGSAWGYTVYYSESASLNLTLQLYRLSEQGIGYNFDFKLAYKFLKRSEAKLRYGNSTLATWRGELVPGTYCDRVLDRCDIRSCRIQSPNFPGVYPRNVTCYYRVEQTLVPRGKHALLAVRQRNSHKIHIKDQVVKYDRSQRVLRVWDQCNVVQDYLTVYDGGSTLDPVLVRLCGGDVVPDIISSGPSMLLEFHTSPYDNPFHPVPLSYLPGFELEVQVLLVDLDSNSYVSRENRNCEFLLTSFDSTWGELGTPRHSLPPNSTCRYHFQGRRHETVWLSFVKYHADLASFEQPADTCNARLRIWDGRHGSASPALYQGGNVSLLGEFCKDEVPRLCDHSLLSNSTRHTRPCSLSESYVSSGSELTLELSLRQGSALYPVSFVLRYEFVDTALEGSPMSDSGCDRVFMSGSGRFQSPRSVFLFGRGGATNLSCVFRFVTSGRQSVRLTFTRARFGDRRCESRMDPRGTGRWRCESPRYKPQPAAQLWVSEYPWPGVRLSRDCLCSSLTTEPMVVTALTSSVVEVNFTVNFMNITEDFRHFFFEGEYQFLSSGMEDLCSASRDERRLRGSSGEIALRSPGFAASKKFITDSNAIITYEANDVKESVVTPAGISCVNHPWLIEPADSLNNYLYLKVRGYEVQQSGRCDTLNRILVYSGVDGRGPLVVCPADLETMDYDTQQLEVFSDGWNRSRTELMPSPHARSFVVEFLEREPASYVVTWMEVSKRPLLGSSSSFVMSNSVPAECPYRCPELNACISSALWCDGSRHCPSGFDEDDVNCAASLLYHIPLLYVAIGAGALGVLALLIALTAGSLKYRQYRRRTSKKTAAANHINHNGYSPATQHADMYGKDSLC